ncbi:MAG: RraA family protein [Chloroflexi bacterium]|nr:RraA family protein [Chloroflexota bacterium]
MDEKVEAYKRYSTAAISDAMDRLGVHGQALGIAPLDPSFRLVGRAFTVHYRTIGYEERGTVGDYIDDVPPGDICVLDNAGRLDATVWGNILTEMSHIRGVGGTVINGVCRDVARSLELGYPIFSKSRFMRTGKDRVECDAMNVPVSLGDVQVRPGDILVGDADGIVVVPKIHEDSILEAAADVETAEDAILERIRRGMRLVDARKEFAYHQLQTRR